MVVGGDNIDSINKIINIYREVDSYAKHTDYTTFNSYAFHNINPKYIEKLPDFDKRVVITNIETAELIKTTANSFLALKISFANMISRLCDKTGAESDKLMDGIGLDLRIGRAFLYPGLGYGGGCFPKDINGMIQTANFYDVDCDILESADVLNNNQIYFALYKIKKLLGEDLDNKKIAFLGLSFKPGTSDVRKSPSIRLIKKLLDEGAIVNAYDPEAIEEAKKELNHKNLNYFDKIEDVFNDADCIVLGTEWKEFIDFDYSNIINKMRHLNFLDGRNAINTEYLKKLNFNIERF
ncbi:MAG: UDP-glucose 6-dehydrogenase TuaD [Candidatus Dependentiae bacterium ADurb.Bin246]|nr:MAG: UDP-glucose 6-dehydrogenase TuaD [Candidatus Dependentiae bacterium ADurb.Bin246]